MVDPRTIESDCARTGRFPRPPRCHGLVVAGDHDLLQLTGVYRPGKRNVRHILSSHCNPATPFSGVRDPALLFHSISRCRLVVDDAGIGDVPGDRPGKHRLSRL